MSEKKEATPKVHFPTETKADRDMGIKILNNYDSTIPKASMEHGESRPKVLGKNKTEGQDVRQVQD